MATSAWFDHNGYMANKLVQVQKADPAANWDMVKLVKAFSDAGFVGDVGAEKHFEQFGQYEDVAPNAFFNATEYYRAKAAEFYKKDYKAVTDLDVATIQVAIKDAGMSAWSHYEQFGNTEKVNPSNSFDTEAYMNAKLTALNNVKDGKQYTLPEVYEAFKAAGLSALEHFMLFGGNGDGEVTQKIVDGKMPTEFAVPENKKVNGGNPGTTFPLTDKVDTLVGTAGDDTFVAADGTLNTGDSLNGMGGTNTLKIYGTSGGDTFTGVTLTNIQKVYNYSGLDDLDLSAQTGVNEYWIAGGVSSTSVTGNTVSLATAVGVEGVAGTQSFIFKDADKGTSDSATLLLKGAEVSGITIANVENITIVASGESTIGNLVGGNLQNLIITGAGSVEGGISGSATTLKSINASANTGGVDLLLASTELTADFAFTGGAGADTITTDAVLTKAQYANFKGGDSKDILGVGSSVGTFDKAVATAINAATGFEVLEINYAAASSAGGTATLAASEFAVHEFLFSGEITGAAGSAATASGSAATNGGEGVTVTSVENADIFTFSANLKGGAGTAGSVSNFNGARGGDAVSFAPKTGIGAAVDTLNFVLDDVTLTGGAAASAGTAGTPVGHGGHAVNAEGFSTINISSIDGAGSALVGGASSGAASAAGAAKAGAAIAVEGGVTINITGNANLDLASGVYVNGDIADTGKVTINAKDFTGALTVATGAGSDAITGGAKNDTITGGAGHDTITGGAGNDTFAFTNGDSGMGANIDIITDFQKGANADKLKLNAADGVLADRANVDVKAAISGAELNATVKGGVITLSGAGVTEVDTIAEIAAIFSAIEASSTIAVQDKKVAVLEIGGHTYVIADMVNTGNAATDVIMLQGVTGITSVTYGATSEFHLA